MKSLILKYYKEPEGVAKEEYKGIATVIFEVDKEGGFQVLYVNSKYEELNIELERVFEDLPSITSATYNVKPIYVQFRMPIQIPLTPTLPNDTTAKKKIPYRFKL